jgi:hypothetical protein
MSAAFKPLEASAVPGQLCQEDKNSVAVGFNALRRRESSPKTSGLRIIDTLDTRFVFVVTHPRNVNMLLLKTLTRSVAGIRRVVLDIPRDCVKVECWRSSRAETKRGTKRPRQVHELLALPESLARALARCDSDNLNELMLWILNRPEDFCVFDVAVEKDESANAYHVRMVGFDAVTDAFLRDLAEQWRTVVRDVVVEWPRKCVTLVVSV